MVIIGEIRRGFTIVLLRLLRDGVFNRFLGCAQDKCVRNDGGLFFVACTCGACTGYAGTGGFNRHLILSNS